jgi:hypothetical protein
MTEVIIYLGVDVNSMVQCLYAKWVMEIVNQEVGVTGIVNKNGEVAQLVRAGFLEVRFLLSLQRKWKWKN